MRAALAKEELVLVSKSFVPQLLASEISLQKVVLVVRLLLNLVN